MSGNSNLPKFIDSEFYHLCFWHVVVFTLTYIMLLSLLIPKLRDLKQKKNSFGTHLFPLSPFQELLHSIYRATVTFIAHLNDAVHQLQFLLWQQLNELRHNYNELKHFITSFHFTTHRSVYWWRGSKRRKMARRRFPWTTWHRVVISSENSENCQTQTIKKDMQINTTLTLSQLLSEPEKTYKWEM